MTKNDGKVLLITGASRGIGRAVALLAGSRGYAVAVNYHLAEAEAEATAAAIRSGGGQAVAIQADVGCETEITRLFETVDRVFGRLDGLVNNAGVAGTRGTLAELDAADMERVFRVNVFGAMLCAREAMRRMAVSRGGVGGGIVSISSQTALFGGVGLTPYAASKAAINAFTIGFAREAAVEGVRANAVSPGVIDTAQHRGIDAERRRTLDASLPMGRFGRAEEVAETILWLLSDASSYVSGAVIPVHGAR